MKCEVISSEEKKLRNIIWACFSKVCPYATSDEKVCKDYKYVSIKFA
jgi:hypothetical protein